MALLGVSLAGCGETSAAEKSTTVSQGGQAEGAEAFVRSLYLDEQGGTAVRNEDPTAAELEAEANEPLIWSERTGALIAETEALGNPGEYAYFEANPICGCQDDGGMMLRRVTVTPTGADTADATVVLEWTMADPVDTQTQTFNLVREGGAWKIDDIQRDQLGEYAQPPLVQDMERWIAETRAENASGGNAG